MLIKFIYTGIHRKYEKDFYLHLGFKMFKRFYLGKFLYQITLIERQTD